MKNNNLRHLYLAQLSSQIINIQDFTNRQNTSYINIVRKALGMTTRQLGHRLGISQQAVVELEKREKEGSVTLKTLAESARALKCRLVYKLVPEEPFEQIIENQIAEKASESIVYLSHHMDLEGQKTSDLYLKNQEDLQKQNLRSGKLSKIWE